MMPPVDEIRLNFNPASLVALNAVLAFLMFGIALDTRIDDFKRVLKLPVAMAAGIAAQFLLLPAITFGLTLVLRPAPSIALGMILVACCPPGNISTSSPPRGRQRGVVGVDDGDLECVVHRADAAQPAFWGGLHPSATALRRSRSTRSRWAAHRLIIGAPFGWASCARAICRA